MTIGSATTTGVPAALDNSDALDLERGAVLTATTAATLYADFEADGGALLSSGSFSVLSGTGDLATGGISGSVVVVNGGVLNAAQITLDAGTLVEDDTAIVEIGTAGGAGAAKGVVTIDAGAVLTLGGSVTIAQAITDNGDLLLSNTTTPGVTLDQSVTGTGAFDTGANATVDLVNASLTGLARVHLGQGASASFFGGSITSVGAVVLDTGSTLITGALANDGPITLAASAALTATNVSGASTIAVGTGGKLTVSGTLAGLSGVTMGVNSVLTLTGAGDTNVPISLGTHGNVALNLTAGANIGGAVSGFDGSDLIENRPSGSNSELITRVTYTPGMAGAAGTLTLLSGTDIIDTVALAGSYTGQQFLTNFTGIGYGDSDITLPGAFLNGIGAGTQKVTGSAFRSFTLVTGGGNSGALTLTANLALAGAYTATSLSTVSSAAGTDDTTDILANSSLSVTGSATVATNVQLTDNGAAFTVGGLLTLGGDTSAAPQVILAGTSSLRAANLTITGATGEYVTGSNSVPELAILGSSTAELGGGALATAGTLAIDAGATLTLAADVGEIVATTVIDDGLITMANPSQGVQLGYNASSYTVNANVTGTGTLQASGSLLLGGTLGGLAVAVAAGSSLTVDGLVSGLQSLSIGASSSVSFNSLSYSHALEVGASASLTVGGLGDTGSLTGLASLKLDAGASAIFTGGVSGVGPITVSNGGSLEFDNGGSGSGAIALGTGVTLTLVNGALTGWSGLSLAGADVIATYGGANTVPIIGGFDTSDLIELTTGDFYGYPPGQYYTGATWTQGTNGSGTLALTEDGQALQSYTLAGSYSASQFITYAGDTVEGTNVGSSTLTLANGTQAGLNGTTVSGDTGGSFLLLTGTGAQQSQTINGDVAVTGAFTFGTVQFVPTTSSTATDNAVLIEAGGSIAATTAAIDDTMEVDGPGATLTVAGTVAFDGTTGSNALIAFNGAVVQVGGTTTSTPYDYAAVDFAVDATASIEVGRAGGAALGTLTVDAGSTLRTDSGVNIGTTGGLVVNGTWVADDTASNLSGIGAGISNSYVWGASVTGSGSLQIAAGTFVSVVNSVIGLSGVSLSGGGLSVSGSLLGIGAVTIAANSSITVSGVGTSNFSAGTLTLADAASNSTTGSFSVSGNANGTGAFGVGAHDAFKAGGTVSGWTSITAGAGASLEFDGAEQASPITLGAGAALRLGNGATVSGVISGFGKTNFISYGFNALNGTGLVTDATWAQGNGSQGTLTLSDDGTVLTQLTLAGSYTGEDFLTNFAGEGDETVISLADPPCYCPGTLIRTDRGDVAVEALAVGDRVVTVSGALRPVVWIGRRSYGARVVRRTRSLHPVCIRAGAFAPGLPARDLWVSPQHAIFLEGVLIPARCLVDGVGVVAPEADADVHYFHVELADHDVIWANGIAAESFIDDDSRGIFHNAHERAAATPAPAVFCAPRVESGWQVEAARQRLLGRRAA